jgi:hypothetical protein
VPSAYDPDKDRGYIVRAVGYAFICSDCFTAPSRCHRDSLLAFPGYHTRRRHSGQNLSSIPTKGLTPLQYNVLIDAGLHVKLCDFGLSAVDTPLGHSTMSLQTKHAGTMNWMSPERFGPNATVRKGADVWGFGCVCYSVRFLLIVLARLTICSGIHREGSLLQHGGGDITLRHHWRHTS